MSELNAAHPMAFTTSELEKYLRRCGYDGERLRRDYTYSDANGARSVSLAGFAYQTCDARDACVAAHDLLNGSDAESKTLASTYARLGAPVFFACRGDRLEWWNQKATGPVLAKTVPAASVERLFDAHKDELGPERIYRAKTLGRLRPQYQLSFVDVGLMPVLEERMGQEVAGLVNRMLLALRSGLGKRKIDQTTGRWLFKAAFWLLAAKVLKDKQVRGFATADLNDVPTVLELIAKHYGSEEALSDVGPNQTRAIQAAAEIVSAFSSLENLTVESLAYVYENTLIDKPTRKALGIHATPSYLVDYIVWQLFDWICEIPEEKRHILEPTCGHAPFLVAGARLLRELLDEQDPKKRHDYLKRHLLGVETDGFAREVARLSLTLADIPNPNGWHLKAGDIYAGRVLSAVAARSTILLCNPPFQNFTQSERSRYDRIAFHNKAAALLARTLPYMPEGSVFGVIVPRGFLQMASVRALRKNLLEGFEIRQITALPDNVFASADQESAVILGRRNPRRSISTRTNFVWVREKTLDAFRSAYRSPTETVPQSSFLSGENLYDLVVPELRSVWEYCRAMPDLTTAAIVGKGLEFKSHGLPTGSSTIQDRPFSGAVRGYHTFPPGIRLTGTPDESWMSLEPSVIRRQGLGMPGIPQVIMNYAPVSRGPWRIKALVDVKGHCVTRNFLVIRPKSPTWTLEALWAILNSPVSNAFAYCHSNKRTIPAEIMKRLPLPSASDKAISELESLVRGYRRLYVEGGRLQRGATAKEAKDGLLAVDAEVMRLYDLPPRLERQVLDLFTGWERPGVGFKFDRYFREDFSACIPLHEYLSEEFQRSTVDFVKQWVNETRSPELIKALETATGDFEEERDADIPS